MAQTKKPVKKKRSVQDKSFEFMDVANILRSTGYKARTLRDLRDCMETVSEDCIFHHTCQYFLKGHVQEFTSDFSRWASEDLEERALAEMLSNIDPYSFKDIEDLRLEIIRVIDSYLENFPEPREVLPGDEFYFNETMTFVFSAGIRARNIAEFLIAVKYLSESSLYYHFYESRVRLRKGTDDFSKWIEEVLKAPDIAAGLRGIDPFMHNIEGLREHIVEIVEAGLTREMEEVAE